jgi:SecD/SecF fusion protein
MKRSFLFRTIICLIPTALAGALVVWAYLKDPEKLSGFKLGTDLSGGTVLVYELDQELSKQARGPDAGGNRATVDQALLDSIKRRIDENDLKGIVVRGGSGGNRVEIVLPYGSRGSKTEISQADVEDVKQKIQQVGSLEFRILANRKDDEAAIAAAEEYFKRAQDSKESDEARTVDAAARNGSPPPFPNRGPNDLDPFMVAAMDPVATPVEYAWVEVGKHERAEHGLKESAKGEGRYGMGLYAAAEAARKEGRPFEYGGRFYYSRESRNEKNRAESEQKKFDYFVLTRSSEADRMKIGGDISINAYVSQGKSLQPVIGFSFNSAGANKFYQLTNRNRFTGESRETGFHRLMGIILDGYLISAPQLNEPLRDGGIIEGNFTRKEVEQSVALLRSGALPATLKKQPVSENTIGPTLGQDTIRSGVRAVGLAYLAILVFMIIYYRFAGFVATVALLANLLLTIGFMVAVNATFTLPGLAGLVLMLGMAVDANVLIYERLREERDRGMKLDVALRNGYDRAFGTIIDTHLTSIFTAVVLYAVGNDQLKGFGVSLTVGLIISLFTSLYMTRLLFDFWLSRNWLTQLKMLRFFSKPNIDFMRVRKAMFALTGALTILGLGLFLFRGKQGLNVDFNGGTAYSGRLAEPLDIGALRDRLGEKSQKDRLVVADVREVPDAAGKGRSVYEITYDKAAPTLVTLANPPVGATPEERAARVKERASHLPDWSVEQVFSGDSSGDKSSIFTVRTTEKEAELVLAAANRLMTDGDKSLLVVTKAEVTKDRGDYLFTFDPPVSRSLVSTFVERQLQANENMTGTNSVAADVFDVVEESERTPDGRAKVMRVKVNREANAGIQILTTAKDGVVPLDAEMQKVAREFSSRPQPERLETFDGTLASETQNRALYAILASWLAILLYLWFRFGSWTFGLAAILCLVHDLCFTLGAIALSHYLYDTMIGKVFLLQDFKIDLPAVAALLTLVGYSVNEIIVNFARLREIRGKNPVITPQMINNSVNQTLSRTVLTSTTVFLVSFVLYAFGGEGIHLFAFVMMMGVLISTYSSVYIASPLLLILGEGKVKHPAGAPAPVETAAQPA